MVDLVVDIGNSDTVLGIIKHDNLNLVSSSRVSTTAQPTVAEYRDILLGLLTNHGVTPDDLNIIIIGSVVPSITYTISDILENVGNGCPVVVTAKDDLPINLDLVDRITIGVDRVANMLAAKEMYRRDTIVVDLGTATTFDCITADGVFMGGVISQGVRSGIEWLGKMTAKLPEVEISPPKRIIGCETEECIRSGVFYSAVDAIDGIVNRIIREWGISDAYVVATGGYATMVAPHTKTVNHVESSLTLYGLALAGRSIRG